MNYYKQQPPSSQTSISGVAIGTLQVHIKSGKIVTIVSSLANSLYQGVPAHSLSDAFLFLGNHTVQAKSELTSSNPIALLIPPLVQLPIDPSLHLGIIQRLTPGSITSSPWDRWTVYPNIELLNFLVLCRVVGFNVDFPEKVIAQYEKEYEIRSNPTLDSLLQSYLANLIKLFIDTYCDEAISNLRSILATYQVSHSLGLAGKQLAPKTRQLAVTSLLLHLLSSRTPEPLPAPSGACFIELFTDMHHWADRFAIPMPQ